MQLLPFLSLILINVNNAAFNYSTLDEWTDNEFTRYTVSKTIQQPLDHFNSYNSGTGKTFTQRWYYNDAYWSGAAKQGPIIFKPGGEGPNGGSFGGFFADFAQKNGGLLISAEHRFYGESMPFGTTIMSRNYAHDSDHLGLLQVEQALADYMTIVNYAQSELFNCTKCPIIVSGVSYSGELSVWLRLTYPQYFDMALSSSGPIFYTSNSIVDPYCYFQIVTNTTRKIGGDKCVNAVRQSYQSLIAATPDEITKTIPLCYPLSTDPEKGIEEFEAYLFQNWANLNMGSYPPSSSSINGACERMLNGDQNNGLGIMSRFLQPYQTSNGCIDLTRYIPAGPNATIHCSDLTGCGSGYDGESWDYQACSQNIEPFSTNNETDMFPVYEWSMDWLDNHCMSRFKIKASTRQSWMETEFGLSSPYFENKFAEITSRIIFSNGEQDGWSAGGVLKNMSESLIAIVIPNGAHHSDMRGSSSYDTQDIKDAREQERNILKQWIKEVQQQNTKLV
eukprot:479911_1